MSGKAYLFDTHCHLDAAEFEADRDPCFRAAIEAGVSRLLIPGVAPAGFAAILALCQRYREALPAYGIHPLYVMAAEESDLDQVALWLEKEKPVAVGEIGLDYYVPDTDHARQEHFFVAQLKLARERGLPVILHSRRAVDAVLKHLRRIQVPGGIAHAFNGSLQQAQQFLDLGFKLGFGGAMTYTGSTRIRHLATTLPLEGLVLETDAPDIPPAWLNGQRNGPDQLPRIAEVLAALRGIPVAEVVAATTANAEQVLGL